MVGGNVEELARVTRLLTTKLVDEGVTCGSGEERIDDVRVDDVGEGVALLGKASDVVTQGLVRLLFAALEVPGVP